jgi:hypothetical protein
MLNPFVNLGIYNDNFIYKKISHLPTIQVWNSNYKCYIVYTRVALTEREKYVIIVEWIVKREVSARTSAADCTLRVSRTTVAARSGSSREGINKGCCGGGGNRRVWYTYNVLQPVTNSPQTALLFVLLDNNDIKTPIQHYVLVPYTHHSNICQLDG